jgi:hypothetical protein
MAGIRNKISAADESRYAHCSSLFLVVVIVAAAARR